MNIEINRFINYIIDEVRKYSLSPFEQYMYLYNIVKNFKPYRESNDNYLESRSSHLLFFNEHIVCEGYANMFNVLFETNNIKSL